MKITIFLSIPAVEKCYSCESEPQLIMHGFTKSIQINIIPSKYGFIWNRFANELR